MKVALDKVDSIASYDQLKDLHNRFKDELSTTAIKQLKSLLSDVLKNATKKEVVKFPSLFARLAFVYRSGRLTTSLQKQLSQFRYMSKDKSFCKSISKKEFLGLFSAIGYLIQQLGEVPQPNWLSSVNTEAIFLKSEIKSSKIDIKFEFYNVIGYDDNTIRLDFQQLDTFILFLTEGQKQTYASTLQNIKEGDRVCLIDIIQLEDNELECRHIILEPGFTIDVSSIASTVRNIAGTTNFLWQQYFLSDLLDIQPNIPMHKGNVVNDLLDKWIYSNQNNPPVFIDNFKESFSRYPLVYTKLFNDDESLMTFLNETKDQNENLKRIISQDLPQVLGTERAENILLEPSFLSNKYGIQGRLDLLYGNEEGEYVIIELKSGRLPYPYNDLTKVDDAHAAQARLYELMLSSVTASTRNKFESYICYSAGASDSLRFVSPYVEFEQKILNNRNNIINGIELISQSSDDELDLFFSSFDFNTTGIELIGNMGWVRRDYDNVYNILRRLSDVELDYFKAFYRFIYTELMLHKLGSPNSTSGSTSLWNKEDDIDSSSNHLTNLTIEKNNSTDLSHPNISFRIADFKVLAAKSIRIGDLCVLYQQKNNTSVATDNQIYKGTISSISSTNKTITISLRYSQNEIISPIVFNNDFTWSVDRDYVDRSFSSMIKSLFRLMTSVQPYKELILGISEPTKHSISDIEIVTKEESPKDESRLEQNAILNEALSAEDYYLIIGPPGTGKTSIMLKNLVRRLHNDTETNILLLAYTNRAVDEICDAVNKAIINFDARNKSKINFGRSDLNFIRIGSDSGTAQRHKHNLLSNACANSNDRSKLKEVLSKQRVFISTVSSISSQQILFDLKEFHTVIIDEASQILEPQIVGLLPHFKKYILIGDQKQLPAISQQSAPQAKRFSPNLEKIHMVDLRVSYFERLLNNCLRNKWSHAYGMLTHQGRMHKDIATFPNHSYYDGKLKIADLPHQTSNLPFALFDDGMEECLAKNRLLYFPSYSTEEELVLKSNHYEAKKVATIVKNIQSLYDKNTSVIDDNNDLRNLKYDSKKTIGIITPYRSQIALIKSVLEEMKIPYWEDITVDTVERYQGSQRDIIILSLAVNSHKQLNFLSGQTYLDLESQKLIDRKLNVAITRSREQLIVTGNPYLLSQNSNYNDLLDYIKIKGGYIDIDFSDIDSAYSSDKKISTSVFDMPDILTPSDGVANLFDVQILDPIKANSPEFPEKVLGYDGDYNRNYVLEYGRTDFDQEIITHSAEDKVKLYCYYNLRKHYFTQLAVLYSENKLLSELIKNHNNKITILDFGCGPATAAIAYQSFYNTNDLSVNTNYIGIDISSSMLIEAASFLNNNFFKKSFLYNLSDNFNREKLRSLKEQLSNTSLLLFNYSYLFTNISTDVALKLAEPVKELKEEYPLSTIYLIYQNSARNGRNKSYNIFKEFLPPFEIIKSAKPTFQYKNKSYQKSVKTETVYYEILKL